MWLEFLLLSLAGSEMIFKNNLQSDGPFLLVLHLALRGVCAVLSVFFFFLFGIEMVKGEAFANVKTNWRGVPHKASRAISKQAKKPLLKDPIAVEQLLGCYESRFVGFSQSVQTHFSS